MYLPCFVFPYQRSPGLWYTASQYSQSPNIASSQSSKYARKAALSSYLCCGLWRRKGNREWQPYPASAICFSGGASNIRAQPVKKLARLILTGSTQSVKPQQAGPAPANVSDLAPASLIEYPLRRTWRLRAPTRCSKPRPSLASDEFFRDRLFRLITGANQMGWRQARTCGAF